MFNEKCKPELRKLQNEFIKQVKPFLDASNIPMSVAALGLQKAQINEDHHWPNESTGFWKKETYSSGKPPRWILQLHRAANPEKTLVASLAMTYRDDGQRVPFDRAEAVCCLNTGTGAPSAGVCAPVWLALEQNVINEDRNFIFPEDWGWLIVLGFEKYVQTATANQALAFDVERRTITTLGKGSVTVPVSLVKLLHLSEDLPEIRTTYPCGGIDVTYGEATLAIREFLGIAPEQAVALSMPDRGAETI